MNVSWFITNFFKRQKTPKPKSTHPLGNVTRKKNRLEGLGRGNSYSCSGKHVDNRDTELAVACSFASQLSRSDENYNNFV